MKDYSKYDNNQLIALLREETSSAAEAFNVIYFRYCEGLNSYCLFITENRMEAEDLHQETWLKFHRIAKSGKRDIKLPGYLYTIARTVSIDMYRLKKNRPVQYSELFDIEDIPDFLNLQTDIINHDLINTIALAINQLSPNKREAFALKWFSGLNNQEIAQITGETQDCVKHRCARAMDEVLKILEPVIAEVKEKS